MNLDNIHLWRWYMWLPAVGIASMGFFWIVQPPGVHVGGMVFISVGLTFMGIAEVACHMPQTTIFLPNALGPGSGMGKGVRIIRKWTTPGVILYLVALPFFAFGAFLNLPEMLGAAIEAKRSLDQVSGGVR